SKFSMSDSSPATLSTVTQWAKSGCDWERVYRYLFVYPNELFQVLDGRRWSIAHQIVYHGNVKLLKQILSLFTDNIDIRTESLDHKTLLDVATERKQECAEMYDYVKKLFQQDEFINAAKASNWSKVQAMLAKNSDLANLKPPYSPYFLIHYIVMNGDKKVLTDLQNRCSFNMNVRGNNETPLALAKRLKKTELSEILEPITDQPIPSQRPMVPDLIGSKVSTSQPNQIPSTTFSSLPIPSQKLIGFQRLLLDINNNGDFTV
ncbi:unnamed protein product, partial [Didymodactylos carnosus]